MLALGTLLLAPAIGAQASWALPFGIFLLWIAAILTIFTGVEYLRAAVTTAMRH